MADAKKAPGVLAFCLRALVEESDDPIDADAAWFVLADTVIGVRQRLGIK